jgi:endonuclease/exonuclease/phosphatase family metal-dependent hydrolase
MMTLRRSLFHGLVLLSLMCVGFAAGELRLNQWFSMAVTARLPIRILTHNIRYATSSPFKGEKPWAGRKARVLNELVYNTRNSAESFICLQEVLHVQLIDVLSGLNGISGGSGAQDSNWDYIGVGRDDGDKKGEYSPIIYRSDVWKLQHWETIWLSETPEKPSKGWDASSIRILTIGVFKHRATSKTVLAMNTHLDDQGSKSRFHAAHIILDKIREYLTGAHGNAIAGLFLSGDFNSEETQEAYEVLTATNSSLIDSQKAIDVAEHYGNEITYTGFGFEGEPPLRIDYVLLGPVHKHTALDSTAQPQTWNLPWMPQGYAVLPNRFDDGVFISDHRAVVVDVVLK